MTLNKTEKLEIIQKYRKGATDTASAEVQVALLTGRLEYLKEHFQNNKKDVHSKQGLMKVVSKRKKLLNYLRKNDNSSYSQLISKLGIRK